ncbi:hypothetical protein C8J31_11443 [Rhizobium sp. PP-CC-2G-626]|nr:hypothetical protein C8J31_11443 [Rhizobium sp. PP-CC-2G-626]
MASDHMEGGVVHAEGKTVPKIGLAGDLLHRIDIVKSTTMTLLVAPGSIDGTEQEVLVPFVTLDFKGSGQVEDDDVENVFFSRILTLDNAAYVASDIVGELNEALTALLSISQGKLKPEAQRLKAATTFVKTAHDRAADCLRLLEDLAGSTENTEMPENATPPKSSARVKNPRRPLQK